MNEKVIKIIIRELSKYYSIHLKMCFKDGIGYMDELFFTENSIKVGGLDICDQLKEKYLLNDSESREIIGFWIKEIYKDSLFDKLNELNYDLDRIWFRTKTVLQGYLEGINLNTLNCSGSTYNYTINYTGGTYNFM